MASILEGNNPYPGLRADPRGTQPPNPLNSQRSPGLLQQGVIGRYSPSNMGPGIGANNPAPIQLQQSLGGGKAPPQQPRFLGDPGFIQRLQQAAPGFGGPNTYGPPQQQQVGKNPPPQPMTQFPQMNLQNYLNNIRMQSQGIQRK